jgi:hypothetical protein
MSDKNQIFHFKYISDINKNVKNDFARKQTRLKKEIKSFLFLIQKQALKFNE